MCVIAYSPAGVDIPSKDDIEKMFKKNPHGAGLAITKPDGFTEWHKGYMDLESFMTKLNEFNPQMLKDYPTTLHFRITTKGNTDPETTHPFPLSPQFSDMRKLHGITHGPLVFHNGTITGFGGIGAKVASDSQDFVMGPMFYIMKGLKPGRKLGSLRRTAIEQLIGSSRLLVMMPNQEVYRFGSTWTEHTDKCYYSNMLWRPAPATTNYLTNRNTYYPANRNTTTTPTTQTTITPSREPDEWGCHDYPGAWPGPGKEWIEFQTAEILEMALKRMTCITEGGDKLYKHRESGNEYYRDGETTLVTQKGLELMSAYYLDLYGQDKEDIEQMVKDGNISFDTINELSEFIELLHENKDGTYEYMEEHWYADYGDLALYTKDFLMAYFSHNIEEVTESLLKQGYIEDRYLDDEEEENSEVSVKLDEEESTKMTTKQKVQLVSDKVKAAA